MKQSYKDINFSKEKLTLILYIDKMCREYQAQGFMLSVRQLYYQLVARAMVPNTEQSYKRVASIINDGRMAGYIDWDVIEDRGRDIEVRSHWTSGAEIIRGSANQYHMDMWDNQHSRVFVIVEKAALAGVLGGVCRKFDVPLLAARGYPSVSVVRELVLEHLLPAINFGQEITILHLGDHDPSGIDMTRDLDDRIRIFVEGQADTEVSRIALTMEQINRHKPPPNPAKVTDSRFASYARQFGDESWELDALEPAQLVDLVTGHIERQIDDERWEERSQEIADVKKRLKKLADDFEAED